MLLALFCRYKTPELLRVRRLNSFYGRSRETDLVEVDDWLPEMVLLLVEVPHTNLTKITWMVLVEIGSVMMSTTSHTTTTRMLSAGLIVS
jgi:hypothetical protein